MNKEELQQYRKLYADHLITLYNYNVALTINFNRDVISDVLVMDLIKRLFCRVYRKMFGPAFYKKRLRDKQFPFVAFIEDGRTHVNTHFHGALQVPEEYFGSFVQAINEEALRVDSRMKVYVRRIYSDGWVRYIVKCVNAFNNSLIFYKDLH